MRALAARGGEGRAREHDGRREARLAGELENERERRQIIQGMHDRETTALKTALQKATDKDPREQAVVLSAAAAAAPMDGRDGEQAAGGGRAADTALPAQALRRAVPARAGWQVAAGRHTKHKPLYKTTHVVLVGRSTRVDSRDTV